WLCWRARPGDAGRKENCCLGHSAACSSCAKSLTSVATADNCTVWATIKIQPRGASMSDGGSLPEAVTSEPRTKRVFERSKRFNGQIRLLRSKTRCVRGSDIKSLTGGLRQADQPIPRLPIVSGVAQIQCCALQRSPNLARRPSLGARPAEGGQPG